MTSPTDTAASSGQISSLNNEFNRTTDCKTVVVPQEIFSTIAVVGLLENIPVLIAVVRNKNLHSPMYFFICSLSVSDMLFCIYKIVENAVITFCKIKKLCFDFKELELQLDDVIDSVFIISLLGSILSLSMIAIDRYITIFHALRYHNIMTTKRAVIILAVSWSVCTGLGIPMTVYSHGKSTIFGFFIIFTISYIFILCLYLSMFFLAHSHATRIASLPGNGIHPRVNMKGAITITILLGVFLVCWTPFFVHILLIEICPLNPYCICYISIFQASVTFMTFNSVINPLIYAFRSPELRNTFQRMLCCLAVRQYYGF
ncbi:adrenocorticotropic hormone receptor [Protopterus annectens]|uniref:adrenocorticotropic hormone receptor n=1 Tax=Protopterus annectens TaxID=7888 RepID=UPI001CFC20C5|nr:adrenocorticotropic hormone receptor [Protopterus annectens]